MAKGGRDLANATCANWMLNLSELDAESNYHLGVDCSFTKAVWMEIESKVNFNNLWIGDFVLPCLKNWFLNDKVKHIRSLPVIVSWFIWKAHNQSCFDDYFPTPAHVSSFCMGVLNTYPQVNDVLKIRNIIEENIDNKSMGVF